MIIGVRKIGTINEVPLLVSPPQSSVDMSDNEIVRWYPIVARKNFRCRKQIYWLVSGRQESSPGGKKKKKKRKKKKRKKLEAKCALFSNNKNDSEEH